MNPNISSVPVPDRAEAHGAIGVAGVAHVVFAVTLIGLGLIGLISGDFTQVWKPIPKWLPAHELMAYVSALICLGCGAGLLWQRTAFAAARVLLIYCVVLTLAFKARFIILAPAQEGSYQSCGENAVLVAGAWVLYAWFAAGQPHRALAAGDTGVRIARVIYAWP